MNQSAQTSMVENAQGRHADDFYRTPPEVTRALCDELKLRGVEPRTILDVGCGDGAIGQVFRQAFGRAYIVGIEPDRSRWHSALASDAGANGVTYQSVERASWQEADVGAPDWRCIGPSQKPANLIVSNPPFRYALPFLQLALKRVQPGGIVAFLLISQWDQETVHDDERGKFLDSLRRADGSEGYGMLQWKGRVDFRGNNKTDRVAYTWFLFGPGFAGQFVRIPRSPMGGATQLTLL